MEVVYEFNLNQNLFHVDSPRRWNWKPHEDFARGSIELRMKLGKERIADVSRISLNDKQMFEIDRNCDRLTNEKCLRSFINCRFNENGTANHSPVVI